MCCVSSPSTSHIISQSRFTSFSKSKRAHLYTPASLQEVHHSHQRFSLPSADFKSTSRRPPSFSAPPSTCPQHRSRYCLRFCSFPEAGGPPPARVAAGHYSRRSFDQRPTALEQVANRVSRDYPSPTDISHSTTVAPSTAAAFAATVAHAHRRRAFFKQPERNQLKAPAPPPACSLLALPSARADRTTAPWVAAIVSAGSAGVGV